MQHPELRKKEGSLGDDVFITYFDDHVIINDKRYDKHVECPICKEKLRIITNTHLWKVHQLTVKKFIEMFPEQSLQSPFSTYLYEHRSKRAELVHSTMLGDVDLGYKEKALSYYGGECMWCGEGDLDELCVHHKDGNYSEHDNMLINNDIENLIVLCKSCHSKVHNQEKPGFWEGKSMIEDGFATIILGLYEAYGFDYKDVNLKDTPSRVARSFLDMLQGIDPQRAESILKQNFPSDYNGMVVLTNIPCYSMCPHHFLPVRYNAHFGYIPNKSVLGLSKIPRYIKTIAQAPLLQEDLTEQIVDRFMSIVEPQGCMIILRGQHLCMGCRGIEMPDVSTVTSALRGIFDELPVRNEFFAMIDRHSDNQ